MGVKGFLYMIKTQYKTTLTQSENTDLLLIDGNCILHDVISNYTHLLSPNLNEIIGDIVRKFQNIINNQKECFVHICLDGVPPLPKQLCQKRRRQHNLSFSAFVLPGTDLMTKIERMLTNSFQCDYITIHNSNVLGEGEQKMIQILKKYPSKSATLLSYDSDIVILTLLQIKNRETKTLVDVPSFNIIIDVQKLFLKMEEDNLIERLLWACILCGNDFFPPFRQFKDMTTTEIFTILKKQKTTLKKFEDLSFEDKCSCNNEDVELYLILWKWYEMYFKTNQFITTYPYISEETPCTYCIIHTVDKNEINFPKTLKKDDHLSYVLTDNHYLDI